MTEPTECQRCGATLLNSPCCGRAAALNDSVELLRDAPDAASDALDAIAKLCGCPKWDYPGQVVRDVEKLTDLLRTRPPVVHRPTCSAGAAPCSCDVKEWEASVTALIGDGT